MKARRLKAVFVLLTLLAGVIAAAGMTSAADVSVSVSKDAGEPVNRALFSMVNYPDFSAKASRVAMDAFLELNPVGTQSRLEAQANELEPENDNNDPNVIDWDKVNIDRMLRFVDGDPVYFIEEVKGMGMEPVLLLAYNQAWNSKTGAINVPPRNTDEWLEFVRMTLQTINGTGEDYELRVKYVEIWNEPGQFGPFWDADRWSYYELFKKAARMIHEEFPGVMVGGPVTAHPDTLFLEEFIEIAGKELDFLVFHLYNQQPKQIAKEIRSWVDYVRDEWGKDDLKIIVTESDDWNKKGLEKSQYLFERTFTLLGLNDYILGYHQFCLPKYQEGQFLFGLVSGDGTVIDMNYWPYWIFRDYEGKNLPVKIDGEARDALRTAASVSEDGTKTSVILYNSNAIGGESLNVNVSLPVPTVGGAKTALISRVADLNGQVEEIIPVEKGVEIFTRNVNLKPQSAVAVTIKNSAQVKPFFIDLAIDKEQALVGDCLNITVTLRNHSGESISGEMQLAGIPGLWNIEESDGAVFSNVKDGESVQAGFRVQATTSGNDIGIFAYVPVTFDSSNESVYPHSNAEAVTVLAPVEFRATPSPLYVAPGSVAEVLIDMKNTYIDAVQGTVTMALPKEFGTPTVANYEIPVKGSSTYSVTFEVPAEVKEGTYKAEVVATFGKAVFREDVDLRVMAFDASRKSLPVDLASYLNADGVTFDQAWDDYADFGGRFTFAGELLPKPGSARFLGVDFVIPDFSDGLDNVVQAVGQTIDIPEGSYSSIALLTFALNGNKSGQVRLKYADGTIEEKEFKVSDWCVAPQYGEVPVITTSYRHIPQGPLYDAKPSIFYRELAVNSDKKLVGLELPNMDTIYVMSLTLIP